jgi:hypothetical protein
MNTARFTTAIELLVWNSRFIAFSASTIRWYSSPLYRLLHIYIRWVSWKSNVVKSGDISGQFCGSPWRIHRPRKSSFWFSFTETWDAPSRFKYIISLACFVSFTNSPDLLRVLEIQIPAALSSLRFRSMLLWHFWLRTNHLGYKKLKYWHKVARHSSQSSAYISQLINFPVHGTQ